MSRDTGWAPIHDDRLRPEHVDALIAQKVPYVLIPGFLDPEWCAEITRRFERSMEENPSQRIRLQPNAQVDVVLHAIALPMNVFVQTRPPRMDEYFARVPGDQPKVREIFSGGKDPYLAVKGMLDDAQWTVTTAVEGDQRYLTDIVWATNGRTGAPPHVDSYHREVQCALTRFKHRFSFNTFLQRPETGGNFRVYRWKKENGEFGPWSREVWAEYAVRAGDLLFFDAGNFHEVRVMDGLRYRLFSHMAVGFDPPKRECSIFI